MDRATDPSTCELSVARLKLADDLIFTPQVHGTEFYCHIESPSRGTFYRVGYPEYFFLSLFDGQTNVVQALTHSARALGAAGLTKEQGVQVATWLLENRLAEFVDQHAANRQNPNPRTTSPNRWRINPFWMKLTLGSPDRLLTFLVAVLGWLISPWATAMGLVVIAFGAISLATQWDLFAASTAEIFLPHNWLRLAGCWLILKIVHELAHALTCKYYRGEVRETGLIFILLAPMAYVDVTSCWRFPSKWQRIHVAAAGMYAELVMAAVAAMLWIHTDAASSRQLLHNVIVMASVSTLLFNANPLMRFDGYYILADLLEIPNLGTEAERMFRGWCSRFYFGTAASSLQFAGIRRWVIGIYGAAIAGWRCAACLSLAAAASVLLKGAGVLLAFAALALWFGQPMWLAINELWRRFHESRSSFYRAAGLGSMTIAAAAVLIGYVPWPGSVMAPLVVEYTDLAVVRSRAGGFVERIHVVDGQRVSAGQLLVELRNDDLQFELQGLQGEASAARLKHRAALDRQESGLAQIAWQDYQAVAQRLAEAEKRVAALKVCTPVDGLVIARNLSEQLGTFLKEGAEILSVGDPLRKELLVSAGQEDVETIATHVGASVRFRICGQLGGGVLQRLAPRASLELLHPAMSALAGGPLAVTEVEESKSTTARTRLTEPRFRGVILLTPDQSRILGAGARGYAMFGLRNMSIGEFTWLRFTRWLRILLNPQSPQ